MQKEEAKHTKTQGVVKDLERTATELQNSVHKLEFELAQLTEVHGETLRRVQTLELQVEALVGMKKTGGEENEPEQDVARDMSGKRDTALQVSDVFFVASDVTHIGWGRRDPCVPLSSR